MNETNTEDENLDDSRLVFTDKKGREIALEQTWLDEIIAYHDGKEIGKFEFMEIDEERLPLDHLLEHMSIHPDYQRAGIGTEIMKYAAELFDRIIFSDHFTMEGAAFLDKLREQDII